MATVFASPEIGAPEATPPRNGGIRQRTRDIVYPVMRTDGGAFTGGKRVEFRFRSDSSRFVSFRDTNLVVRLETKFIPGNQDDSDHTKRIFTGNKEMLRNLRFTAAPCTALFSGGFDYQCNSVTIENQPHPYEAAMLNLITKGDAAASATSASNSLLDLSKGCEMDRKRAGDGFRGLVKLQYDTTNKTGTTTTANPAPGTTITFGSAGGRTWNKVNTITVSNEDASLLKVGSVIQFPAFKIEVLDIDAADTGIDEDGDLLADADRAGGAQTGFTTLAVKINDSALASAAWSSVGQMKANDEGRAYSGQNASDMSPALDAFQCKPKHEVLVNNLVKDGDYGGFTSFTEISEPVSTALQSWQHGWACPGADHQLYLTINDNWEDDLFYEVQEISYAQQAMLNSLTDAETDAEKLALTHALGRGNGYLYHDVVNAKDAFQEASYYAKNTNKGVIVTRVASVELHVGYVSPLAPFVPRSVSWAWSSIDVNMIAVKSQRIMESIVIKPSVRLVVLGMRQNHHGVHVDREEMGKAGAKLIELGKEQGTISNSARDLVYTEDVCNSDGDIKDEYRTFDFKTLEVRCGSESKPSPAYMDLDIDKGHYARPYADFIQAIGKNMGLRGTTITYSDYIGKHAANRIDVDTEKAGFGDRGPLFFIPLLLPPGSLQNVLTIDATLTGAPDQKAAQELVVLTVNDELWNMKYAPPAELPLSTSSRQLL